VPLAASLRRLLPGLGLIAAASAVLVLGDRSADRAASTGPPPPRIAVIQANSSEPLEAGRAGLLDRLAAAGVSRERGAAIDAFNAEGDVGTLAQMAAQVCSATPPYDLVVSLSTPAAQAMLRANKRGLPHVFALVASPPGIGLPLGAWGPDSARPPHVAGFGTLPPADALLRILRDVAPSARRVGCVWNPAEPNAESAVTLGRAAAAALGLELLEGNGANVSEVVSAVDVVLSRGIDCFWILADTNVIAAAPSVIERCRRAGVPVISNFPAMAESGAAINYGADYRAAGRSVGAMALLLLGGCPPREIPCENFVPATLALNLDGFGRDWKAPEALQREADRIISAGGSRERRIDRPELPPGAMPLRDRHPWPARASAPRGDRTPVIAVLTYARTPVFEDSYAGFLDELAKAGLADGRGSRVVLRDAQLDIGALGTIVAAIANERPDVVVPFTTPALQATVRRIKDRPVVFSLVVSGTAAGAGRAADDHLATVTGAQIEGDWPRMVTLLRQALPGVRRVGTVFAPGETNSVLNKRSWEAALDAAGIELVAIGADRPTELGEAADGLATRGVEAITQISDVSSSTAFGTIVRAADRKGIPVFAFTPAAVRTGATLAVARDFADVGRESARLVARVLGGESPAAIPFASVERTVVIVNPARLRRFGIELPAAVLDEAEVIEEGERAP